MKVNRERSILVKKTHLFSTSQPTLFSASTKIPMPDKIP